MSTPDDRKHPSAGFWITVALVVVLVGYPAACPLWNVFDVLVEPRRRVANAGYLFFRPIWIVMDIAPEWIERPYSAYCRFVMDSPAGRVIE